MPFNITDLRVGDKVTVYITDYTTAEYTITGINNQNNMITVLMPSVDNINRQSREIPVSEIVSYERNSNLTVLPQVRFDAESSVQGSLVQRGGKRKSAAKSKSAAPKPSAERVLVKGRKRVVYVGPKGGKYIKSKGEFVRL